MKPHNDLLSPDSSPQKLNQSGVKRVNNLPLIIAIGVLTIFVLLIASVAVKRANAQNQREEVVKIINTKKNVLNLANEVVGNHSPGILPAPIEKRSESEPLEVSKPFIPVTQKPDVEVSQTSDIEMERIRQEKTRDFEEAVKAKTAVMVDNSRINNKDENLANHANMNVDMDIDVASNFKSQLQLLQQKQNAKPVLLNIGGVENEMRWHLNSNLENPHSRYELRAGSVIPGVMISGISSELPGQLIAQVSQNVFDTSRGKHLLIPQGTKLIGVYSSDVGFGQNSVLVAWQRLVFPDGRALDIGSMPGADSAGYAGFRDQVDHHYVKIYGSALLMSGIVAGITYSQNTNQTYQNGYGYGPPTAGSVLSQALGQQLGEVTGQLISKNLNISPTVNVRPGYRFNIIAVKDLIFKKPYQQFAY